MSLNSLNFFVCFVLLLLVLLLLQGLNRVIKNISFFRMQILILLLSSYIFMIYADAHFAFVMLFMTVFTYILGIYIEKAKETSIRKKYLCFGIVICVIVLAYFKYSNFFCESFFQLFGEKNSIDLNIILPLGISFYTFTAISYLIDVYISGGVEKNLINFALFMSFFPKITAGPIVRGKDFLPQIEKYKGIQKENILIGIQIVMFGLFKKIVLADRLGIFVDDVFYAPLAYHTVTVGLAVISYSMQIYFDFSGYSDIAIGISKILGFDFAKNFNLPYVAKNISEFWKRWHISLSSWFQDYLYIPLGGSRKGNARTYFNLIAVMLVSGLWHGAGWTFVVWGLFYGIASCIYKWWVTVLTKVVRKHDTWMPECIKVVLTFIIVSLFWVVFRATSLENAMMVYKSLFTFHDGIVQPYTWTFFSITILTMATIIAKKRAKKTNDIMINGFYPILDLSKFWCLVVFFVFCGLTIMLGYFGNNVFIYGIF